MKGLVINNFGDNGIDISTSGGNVIEGNFIGTNVTGTVDLGNVLNGVDINGVPNNTVGGVTAAARNVISGNSDDGVDLNSSGATGNTIQGNFIGTDSTGAVALPNADDGVTISAGVNNNTIGGTVTAARNIISGNGGEGIDIRGAGATGNKVQGNFIGTDVNGTSDLANSIEGVIITNNASNNTIGGTSGTTPGGPCTGACNVISGNNSDGVEIATAGATGNKVQGNYIGTDVTGTVALGNNDHGVNVLFAPNTTIGGTGTGEGNVISANAAFVSGGGVSIFGSSATGNLVQGNLIGTDVTGTANLGNQDDGVKISGSASSNTVGGTVAGARNTIAFNTGDGVFVSSGTGNDILSNSIFSNTEMGIDLGTNGVTTNDAGDADSGANNLQNFPVLTSAVNGSITIQGTLNSTANITFRIEFFSNTVCDTSGFGEGKTFLGSTNATTDGTGNISFSATLAATVSPGSFITATATDPGNNTSEFSQCLLVVNQAPVLTAIADQAMNEGTTLNLGVSATDADGDALTLSVTSLPSFASFTNPTTGAGTFTFIPGFNDAGTYPMTVTASDGSLTDDDAFTLTVNDVGGNQSPVLTAIADQAMNERTTLNLNVSATDPDGDALTLSVTSLPTFGSFTNPTTGAGTFTFIPGSNDAGTYPMTVTVSDGSLTDDDAFTLTVNDVAPQDDEAPIEIKVLILAKGDYNGDGRITARDALAALKMSLGELPEDLNLDMDGDGEVTIEDARQLLTAALAAPGET